MNTARKGITHFKERTGISPSIPHEGWLTGVQDDGNQSIITINSSDYTSGRINANSIPVDLIGNPWLMDQYLGHIAHRVHNFIEDRGEVQALTIQELDIEGTKATVEFLKMMAEE